MKTSLLPKSNLKDIKIVEQEACPSKTWNINNSNAYIDGLEAIKQSVLLALSVNRYNHLIYSWNYGHELVTLIGKDFSYVKTEAPRLIKECLLQDKRIKNVNEFKFIQLEDMVNISFNVETNLGSFKSEVVV